MCEVGGRRRRLENDTASGGIQPALQIPPHTLQTLHPILGQNPTFMYLGKMCFLSFNTWAKPYLWVGFFFVSPFYV